MSNTNMPRPKIKQSDHIFALKIKTEGNGLGALKTIIVVLLIAFQLGLFVLLYLYLANLFRVYLTISIVLTIISSIHVLSSDYHGQAKATWILFLLISFGFGYIMYILSHKSVMFAKSKRKYSKVYKNCEALKKPNNVIDADPDTVNSCNYLYNSGNFVSHTNTKLKYFPSGTKFFDDVLEELKKAKEFVFIEFFIVSNGMLLTRILDVLKEKAKQGVDVKIIYDDMGSHGTLKDKTKKEIIKSGIKLQPFNRLVPFLNIALNLRDHRKIIVIDGKVSYTGGTNLADEYTNEKRMHGYWKDAGIKMEGPATDNLTIAFLNQWQFLKNEQIDYEKHLNKAETFKNNSVVVPFVSGPNYDYSIAQNIYAEEISKAKKRLYIMTPYFIPDETISNLIINKAKSGVDVRIILPDIADKKFVYVVSRNNAEKMMKYGVKVYTMTHSFVHSKIVMSDSSVIVGSINIDLRSFNQQFESAVFTNDKKVLDAVTADFEKTFSYSKLITKENQRRRFFTYRLLGGMFNIISPFM